VLIRNALKILLGKPIIKNIVQMSVAELQQIKESWKSIMKKKLSKKVQSGYVKHVNLSLADTTQMKFALPV